MSATFYYITCSSDPEAKYGPFEDEDSARQIAVLYDLIGDCRSRPGTHDVDQVFLATPLTLDEAINRLREKRGAVCSCCRSPVKFRPAIHDQWEGRLNDYCTDCAISRCDVDPGACIPADPSLSEASQ